MRFLSRSEIKELKVYPEALYDEFRDDQSDGFPRASACRPVSRGALKQPRDIRDRYSHPLEGPFDEGGAIERTREFQELAAAVLELAEAESVGV